MSASHPTAPLSRRTLLRGLAGAAIGLPFLEAMGPRNARAGSSPKRFIVMFSPSGTLADRWMPSGGETDFTLSPILEPLTDHRDDLVIVQGLTQQGGGGDAHQNGIGGMLTGSPLNPGTFGAPGAPPAGWASGPSVDQRIADASDGLTQLRSLELGVQIGAPDNYGRMCYRASDQPLPPEDDPQAVYARVFADLHTDPAVLAHLRQRRRSILDTVGGEYARIAASVGAADRQRLEAHLDAVREIETRLTSNVMAGGPACHDPTLAEIAGGPQANDSFPAVGELQTDMLVMALACDLTRVASLQWSRSVSPTRFTWLGITETHHELSHRGDDDAEAVEKLTAINRWYAQQMASLLAKLKAIPDGTGTLLDNTLVLWCNELGKGNNHSRKNAPYVLAGRAGGALGTGRFLKVPSELPHNDLLVSLVNAMGLPDTTFGKSEWCNGPLPGLL